MAEQRSMGNLATFVVCEIPSEVEHHDERWYKFASLGSADVTLCR